MHDLYGYNEIEKYPVLPASEQLALARRAQQGDREARDLLVLHNLRLAWSVIKPFMTPDNVEDLFNEAVCGIVKAVKKFDPDHGHAFSTYAMWWIRQSVGLYIAGQNRVYIPRYINDCVIIARRYLRQGIEDAAIIAEKEHLKVHYVQHALDFLQVRCVSLDRHMNDDVENENLGFFALTDESDDFAEVDEQLSSQDHTSQYLDVLTDREREVIKLMFGFGGPEMNNMAIIAEKLGISRQRVDQLQKHALKRMRVAAGLIVGEEAS